MSQYLTNPLAQQDKFRAIQEVQAIVNRLDHMLTNQQALLRQRGMTLPPGTIESIGAITSQLDSLVETLHLQEVELKRLRALAETASLITGSLSLDEVLNSVMDTVIRLTGAERGYIVLRDPDTGELVVQVARNLDQETVEKGGFIVSRSVVNEVAQTGEPVVTTNAQNDPRFSNQESVVSYALRSILCVPLKVKGEITGVVYADNRARSGLFGKDELALLTAFANQAAVAIEHARLFERVRATIVEVTANKELLESVFASIASGVITTDQAGTVIICNQAITQIFGGKRDDILEKPIHPWLSRFGLTLDEYMRTVLEKGTRQTIEVTPEIPGRGIAVLRIHFSPLKDHAGQTHGVTLLIDDLTEERRREATLAEIRRYLPPAMVENIREIDTIELGGEEREISVIIADVRGFTAFAEQLEPEELMTIINRYLEVASDAIHLYEGIVDKYMGDAVVGLFNTQLNPNEDHALRAVRAAMSMIYDVRALHELLPEHLQLWYGIGIDTGQAVLGNIGSNKRKEFTAVGWPVTQAKRLQETAERGEIIISPATFERVKHRISAEHILRPFRNGDTAQEIYRVLGFKRRSES